MVTSDLRIFSGTSAMDMFPPVIPFPQSSSIIDHFSFLFWPNCLQLLNRRHGSRETGGQSPCSQSCRLALLPTLVLPGLARALSYLAYLVLATGPQGSSTALPCRCFVAVCGRLAEQTNKKKTMYVHTKFEANLNLI